MRFVVVHRPGMPTVEAGWVVDAGSADAAVSGLGHLLEHMMFKGSTTIGIRDRAAEAAILAELETAEREAATLGPSRRDRRRLAELEQRRSALEADAASLVELGAFSLEYAKRGATRLNANTAEDFTVYYVTLPAERVELWFWMESDRLLQPVFRDLPREGAVIAEERRNRIDTTPTGRADLEVERAYWGASPYGRSPLGRQSDVDRTSRRELRAFFDRHYGPDRLTAVLVGSVDPARARELADRYFGRLDPRSPPPTREPIATAVEGERVLDVSCRCADKVRVLYPAVPFGHRDLPALQALAGLLNGRAGRLHRRLVLEQEIAFSAFAGPAVLRRGGRFEVAIEARGGAGHARLLAAWDREAQRLVTTPPGGDEWERTRRRLITGHLVGLKDPHTLMRRLLAHAGLGDWRALARRDTDFDTVDAETLAAVARRYLQPDRRLVVNYHREGR